jgi:hypothetical protein
MNFKEEENSIEEDDNRKVLVGYKDVIALSIAIYRMVLPKLIITLLALFLAGFIMMKFLGA